MGNNNKLVLDLLATAKLLVQSDQAMSHEMAFIGEKIPNKVSILGDDNKPVFSTLMADQKGSVEKEDLIQALQHMISALKAIKGHVTVQWE